MASVNRFISVFLDGQTPPHLGLAELSYLDESVALVERAFTQFFSKESEFLRIYELPTNQGQRERCPEPPEGICVVYLIGHGWQDATGQFQTSIDSSCQTSVSGTELISQLAHLIEPYSHVLLLVDTCEAESLKKDLTHLATGNYTAIFASKSGERAWNLVADKGTRFAFAISDVLSNAEFGSQPRDAVDLHMRMEALIRRDLSTPDQNITRVVHGEPVFLTSNSAVPDENRRHQAKQRMAVRLTFIGIVLAGSVFLLASYWRSHVFVFLELKQLSRISERPTIVVYYSQPETNDLHEIKRMRVDGHLSAWVFLPAKNLIISVEASYKDGEDRSLRFHRVFRSGFLVQKTYRITLPAETEVIDRPKMAFVSADSWLQGSQRSPGATIQAFWIDMEQITIREYYPELIAMYRSGAIQTYESILLSDLLIHNDLEVDDLPTSFTAFADIELNENTLLRSSDCPAPLTDIEADCLAKRLGKATPTRNEWELAARGVDGRQFPWGEIVSNGAMNAGLPVKAGWDHRQTLRPCSEYPLNTSPFGMKDVVGNAGDWVCDQGQFALMGGELRLNPEDCTTFSYMRLPSSQAGLAEFGWRVGFRGALPSRQ